MSEEKKEKEEERLEITMPGTMEDVCNITNEVLDLVIPDFVQFATEQLNMKGDIVPRADAINDYLKILISMAQGRDYACEKGRRWGTARAY